MKLTSGHFEDGQRKMIESGMNREETNALNFLKEKERLRGTHRKAESVRRENNRQFRENQRVNSGQVFLPKVSEKE